MAGTAELWPYLILLQAIPAIVSLAVTPFMPDTPRYLMIVKHNQPAAQKGRPTTNQPVHAIIQQQSLGLLERIHADVIRLLSHFD